MVYVFGRVETLLIIDDAGRLWSFDTVFFFCIHFCSLFLRYGSMHQNDVIWIEIISPWTSIKRWIGCQILKKLKYGFRILLRLRTRRTFVDYWWCLVMHDDWYSSFTVRAYSCSFYWRQSYILWQEHNMVLCIKMTWRVCGIWIEKSAEHEPLP